MEDLINKKFICKSNSKRYQVDKTIMYKDERSKESHPESKGWITAVIYKPLYECDIPEFSRSLTMFLNEFDPDPTQD